MLFHRTKARRGARRANCPNAAEMMVAIFVMMTVGILLSRIVRRVQAHLLRWQPQFERQTGATSSGPAGAPLPITSAASGLTAA